MDRPAKAVISALLARDVLPISSGTGSPGAGATSGGPATAGRNGPVCVADFYGATAEEFRRPLRRAFARLAPQFAAIRESSTPGGESPDPPPAPD
ncbi:hypothetical protein [Dactylosporangium sp. NPDC000521]|uniref:hypothetical protein n=1 Tax=Dactylosporangium sp. NPDC000521 TaxID=3363975 RepID=UPI00368133C1